MVDTTLPNYQHASSSGWSFTQGFLLGQLSIVILICFFIKYFIFGEPPSTDSHTRAQRQRARSFPSTSRPAISITNVGSSPPGNNTTKKTSSVIRHSPPLTTAAILAKTYYNVNGHQPESVDWFNVLIAQTIAQLRNDAQQDSAILTSLNTALNGSHMPDFIGGIKVTEINLGEEFPIFSNCRVIPVGSDGESEIGGATGARLQARMDVDLSDTITLAIETKLILNYPKPLVAVLPIALGVSVVRFSGTLSISFIPSGPPPYSTAPLTPASAQKPSAAGTAVADPTPPTSLTFSFLPDYRLELSTHSLLGSRSRLQDVPKIAQLVESRLRMWFDERCVEPRFQQVVLPSMWPRKQNTRGGEMEEGEEGIGGTPSKTSPRKRDRRGSDGVGLGRVSSGQEPTAAGAKPPETPTRQAATSRAPILEPPSRSQADSRRHMEEIVPGTRHDRMLDRGHGSQRSYDSGQDSDRDDSRHFVSGRELEAHLHPSRPNIESLRERSRSYRMPGSMPA